MHKTPPETLRLPLPQDAADLLFVSLSRDPPPFKSLSLQSNGNFSGPIEDIRHGKKGKFSGIFIHQSCNGLLLCSTFQRRSYYLLKPTTKQHVALHPPPSYASSPYKRLFGLFGFHIAFDPSKSPHYKAICVSWADIRRYQIEIYSSETRRWSVSGNKFKGRRDVHIFTEGVFWNGNIHWIGAWLRFNVDLECLERMPAGPVCRRDSRRLRGNRYFGESNGHLHLIQELSKEFRVFEMERDYSGWFVKYHVDLGGVVPGFPVIAHSILGVIRQENEDESFLLLNVPGKVVSYNLKDGTLKELLNLAPEEKIGVRRAPPFRYYDTYQYIETLAPV
ncbi:hypothetical protein Vadar_010640 [Vaccinium darrowii]|uniref:Uncharacterized protein n=1 Tax=Vaccinium darrowii TaxID=229202 RepID=A0ACB7XQ17_9ERIC|nr:hypothetical protein Vadar_010640 [Vaccinium darrowii]